MLSHNKIKRKIKICDEYGTKAQVNSKQNNNEWRSQKCLN